jgi:hypothetical protein
VGESVSKKSELAAMAYLAKKKPHKYRLQQWDRGLYTQHAIEDLRLITDNTGHQHLCWLAFHALDIFKAEMPTCPKCRKPL